MLKGIHFKAAGGFNTRGCVLLWEQEEEGRSSVWGEGMGVVLQEP